jgi:hypothetical protein
MVRPFDLEADDGRQLYDDKDSIQSSDSDNDDASTRNILNGCLIKGQKRPSQLMADFMGDQGSTLHCIYEEPSPTKLSRDKSSPRLKNERESSPSQ